MICDEIQQRAEVSAFFQHFDNAEELFASVNRVDLSLAMRIKMGDWFHVSKIIRVGADDDCDDGGAYRHHQWVERAYQQEQAQTQGGEPCRQSRDLLHTG